ncbi:octopamine receptor beta-2R-like [Saccoglossus kowalevskii]|uniref:Alpha-1A adrenergic receptor-like n=1 Tax=Saccoglossus kowalevskii TaxID=10224 RepID=A0ABM0GYB7_SACKO|nr:PREDICTED: alpha-1A adrenergic receptor-like [Saccoglossus kowalevskii]
MLFLLEDVFANSTDVLNFTIGIGNGTTNQRVPAHRPLWLSTLLVVCLSTLAVFTVLSNLLVICVVIRYRFLRTITNNFVVSLAFSDLIMGLFVMPLAIVYDLESGQWNFGPLFCDMWNATEVLSGVGSMANLSMISFERHLAIVHPMTYRHRVTREKSYLMIAITWIVALSLSYPCILWWHHTTEENIPQHLVCKLTQDRTYLITAVTCGFFVPCFIMIFAYFRIYLIVKRQMKNIYDGRRAVRSPEGVKSEDNVLRIHRGNTASISRNPSQEDISKRRRVSLKIQREYRAAKMLAIVIGIFFITWLPYMTSELRISVCGYQCLQLPSVALRVFKWLAYANSALNPLIYARNSHRFQYAFSRVFKSIVDRTKCSIRNHTEHELNNVPSKTRMRRNNPESSFVSEVGTKNL